MTGAARRGSRSPEQLQEMFATIAPCYDRLNHMLSLGADILWRRRAAGWASGLYPRTIIDLACGTGDMALALAERCPQARIAAVDFSEEMLALCYGKMRRRRHPPRVSLLAGDVLRLPFADDAFDLAAVAFGLRNLKDPSVALAEATRVVRAGGWVVALEVTMPRGKWWGWLYRLYFRYLLPALGTLVSRAPGAYQYLRDSVVRFTDAHRLPALMEQAGLSLIRTGTWSGGIATCALGKKPGPAVRAEAEREA